MGLALYQNDYFIYFHVSFNECTVDMKELMNYFLVLRRIVKSEHFTAGTVRDNDTVFGSSVMTITLNIDFE